MRTGEGQTLIVLRRVVAVALVMQVSSWSAEGYPVPPGTAHGSPGAAHAAPWAEPFSWPSSLPVQGFTVISRRALPLVAYIS